MICKLCRATILESQIPSSRGVHHQQLGEFELSASEGCIFCTRLMRNLEGQKAHLAVEWLDQVRSGAGVYRWGLRQIARTSESREGIIVNFRSLPLESDGELIYLPDEIFYLLPEQENIPLPLPSQLGKTTASTQSQDQIKQWIETCVSGHKDCQRADGAYPKRLLDLGTAGSAWPPEHIRVILSKTLSKADPAQRRYVTLSHCWGPNPTFAQLDQDNTEAWMSTGIPWADCCSNKNFAEAMQVARNLGVRYIWIDSLCIIQHNAEDWEEEAPMMRDIYRNSFCNIAASDSADGYGGLFRPRSGQGVAAPVYQGEVGKSIPLLAGRTWRVVAGGMWKHELLGQPLYTRGWVFQERMLAPRLLHFAREQIFWDCATASACEAFPAGLPAQLDDGAQVDRRWRAWLGAPSGEDDGRHMNVDKFWASAVLAYTGNNLTFHKDKLKAIFGIGDLVADAMRERWGDWVAGLWSTRLENQLAWTVVSHAEARRPSPEPGEAVMFPSWSWTSIKGQVRVAQIWAPSAIYLVENHEGESVVFTRPTETTNNSVSVNSLALRCHVGHGVLKHQQGHDRMILEVGNAGNNDEGLIQVFPDTKLDKDASFKFLILFVSKQPAKLRMPDGREVLRAIDEDDPLTEFTYSGLGLLIEEMEDKPGYYERIGVIKFSELSEQNWQQVKQACGDRRQGKGCDDFSPRSASAKPIWLI